MYLTVMELADLLKLSKSQVYALKEKIGFYRIGGSIRFSQEDVQQYLLGCRVNGEEERTPAPRPPKQKLKHIRL